MHVTLYYEKLNHIDIYTYLRTSKNNLVLSKIMNFNCLILFILLLLISRTNEIPVSKESGPNYLYEYGYLSTDTGSDGKINNVFMA